MIQRVDPRKLQGVVAGSGRRRSNRLAPAIDATGRSPRLNPHAEARARVRREFRAALPVTEKMARPEKTAPLKQVPDTAPLTLVVCIGPEPWAGAEAGLLGAARELTPQNAIALLTFGPANCAPHQAGADRVVQLPETGLQEEGLLETVLALLDHVQPAHVLFPHAAAAGDLARRLVARRRCTAAWNVVALKAGHVIASVEGGRREAHLLAPYLVSLHRSACAAYEGTDRFEAKPLDAPAHLPQPAHFADAGLVPARAADIPLPEAGLVLSAGAGITDWDVFRSLADDLSAAVAGSRVVCDAGSLPRARQVGASGQIIEARCYIAMGISGAPQHLQGIQACRHVVAVNTDRHAPIMKRADLAIVADAQAVMRAMRVILAGEALS